MAIEYIFDLDLNCLLIRLLDEVTLDQFAVFLASVRGAPGFGPGHVRLTDLRQATKLPQTSDIYTVAHLMDELDRAFPPARTSLVAHSEMISTTARIFRALREPDEGVIGIHSDIFEALKWLNLQLSDDPFSAGTWDTTRSRRFE